MPVTLRDMLQHPLVIAADWEQANRRFQTTLELCERVRLGRAVVSRWNEQALLDEWRRTYRRVCRLLPGGVEER